MWVEELELKNIKCFENVKIRLSSKGCKRPWITFLSENGGGKSTALQALALLLAGPEGAQKLLPRPLAWLKDESQAGLITAHIHQGKNDPGQHGDEKVRKAFGYSYHVTGSKPITIRNRSYSEPAIIESKETNLSWLRQNALTSTGKGWFAVGYGAFRRLTRSSQIIVPSLEPQARFTNFVTQFNEDDPLTAFEQWMVYLDYRISKASDKNADRMQKAGIAAINELLPEGVSFAHVTDEGRICFRVNGSIVPTTSLSDGYRSVLALAGDLVWRMLQAFPESDKPLHEEGVVLIDELDIHLHPVWQRDIAGWLRKQFPNVQFIVATHSPLIAAGAGEDALTLKFDFRDGKAVVAETPNVSSMNVDRILTSDAFGLLSPYSPETEYKLKRYDALRNRGRSRSKPEQYEYQDLLDFVEGARPFGGSPEPGSLDDRMEKFLEKSLK